MAEKSQNKNELEVFRGTLNQMKGQFNAVLPKGVSVDKFLRVLQTAATTSPELVTADRKSVFAAAMSAAQDGLLPDGKESVIVAYKDKATYMPMINGLIKLIYRCNKIDSISSGVIYKNDHFEYTVTETGEELKHQPKLFEDRGMRNGVYALARLTTGDTVCEIITAEEIEVMKSTIKAKMSPWNGPYEDEMWRKTAIKRLSKRLPIRTTIEEHDEELEMPPVIEKKNEIEAPAS